jgi:hypothetical protein
MHHTFGHLPASSDNLDHRLVWLTSQQAGRGHCLLRVPVASDRALRPQDGVPPGRACIGSSS